MKFATKFRILIGPLHRDFTLFGALGLVILETPVLMFNAGGILKAGGRGCSMVSHAMVGR